MNDFILPQLADHWLLQTTPSHIIDQQSQKSPLSQESFTRGQGSSMEQATA